MSQNLPPSYSEDYYKVCTSNSEKKNDRWFCNKNFQPVVLLTPNKIPLLEEDSEQKPLSSDEESIVDDSDADADYKPNDEHLKRTESTTDESCDSDASMEIPLQQVTTTVARKITETCSPGVSRHEYTENLDNTVLSCSMSEGESKRKRNVNGCYFCESSVMNFARHVFRNHKGELEVQKILALPAKSKERKELLSLLRKKGNYLTDHESGKPVRKHTSTSYLPCIHCLGFYSAKNLWRHRKICSQNPNAGSGSRSYDAHHLITRQLKIDPDLRTRVFPRMRRDKVSLTAKKDTLICAFGARYIKIHREKHLINVASRKMRELAKILMEIQKIDCSVQNLFQALNPRNYEHLVTATKIIAKYDPEKEIYLSPTFAINMGTTLKQCCEIALKFALKKSDIYAIMSTAQAEADLRTTIQLIEGHWKFDISSAACNDLNTKKWNKITIVPLASDLKLLKEYLIEKANSAISLLKRDKKNRQAYNQLVETIFCRVILLNRRRPGELQRFLLHAYTCDNNNKSKTYEEFSEVVSETEKALMKNFKRIVIRGKRGRGVPVLFSTDVQEHMKIALEYRNDILKKQNTYLFPNINTDQPIIGYKILKKYAEACGAKNPDAITCTKLRKHLATLTQLFNMSENDMEQLASFMGHTLGIHRSSYRLPDDLYQTAKISKLLLLMEKGAAGEHKGKKLDEINIDLEENLLDDTNNTNDNGIEIMIEEAEIEDRIYDLNRIGEVCEQSEQQRVEADHDKPSCSQTTKSDSSKKRILVPWTEKQKSVVTTYFKDHIKKKQPPKRLECEKLIATHGDLFQNKNWLKIKVFIQNKYTNKLK
ncbi:uncharacterized protein LOC135137359 [Zophobas morio]|uniref:uncharacterized protein LOC135137359 n=1 Tax=Zophobas morio TaxID=2755281 RepID=UPI003083691D